MVSVEQKIERFDYAPKMERPTTDTDEESREWHAEIARLRAQFEKDVLAEYGFAGHPLTSAVFQLAWSLGKANHFEVLAYFDELSCILDIPVWSEKQLRATVEQMPADEQPIIARYLAGLGVQNPRTNAKS